MEGCEEGGRGARTVPYHMGWLQLLVSICFLSSRRVTVLRDPRNESLLRFAFASLSSLRRCSAACHACQIRPASCRTSFVQIGVL